MENCSNENKVQKIQHLTKSLENKQKMDGELILRDIMHGVCRYMNIKDLSRVAQVCKSWKEEVLREMNKRYLEFNVLPDIFNTKIRETSFHVSNILSIKPYVTLLFLATSTWFKNVRDEDQFEYYIIRFYRRHFPNKLMVVGVENSRMDVNLIHSVPVLFKEDVLDHYIPNGILSLSLPLNKRLNVKESCVFESEFIKDPIGKFNHMIKNLLVNNTKTNSALLVFVSNPRRKFDFSEFGNTSTLNMIKSRPAGKSCTLWGFVTPHKMFASNKYNKDSNGNEEKEVILFGLNLFGPNFESWSTVISVNITKAEMEKKLNTFKKRVHLKRCNTGFITSASILEPGINACYSNNYELVSYVKTVFPEVTFLGSFCGSEDLYFGIDSMSEDANGTLTYKIISIMILSYD